MGRLKLHAPRISISTYHWVGVCICVRESETCFSAFTAEPLLPVSLPHVNVSAAGLRESLPTDPTQMRLLA